MMNEEQRTPGSDDEQHGSEVPAAGSGANASGPAGQPGDASHSGAAPGQAGSPTEPQDLTVDDILGAEQNADAVEADAAAADAENPYLEDLRRLSAEYANYRKRTEANAVIEKQRAIAAAVTPLLTVLDDLDRAEQHGDLLEGTAFATIAQKLRATLERFGLSSFGEKGDLFDPQLHEAIAQVPVPGTEQQTVLDVIERGYRLGDVELRPAKVAVAVGADG
ncbi:nucleotide exchange factor GrpE [Leucobacter luti]|uniref:Protein GrpE n=1 Tax=Leucobacter luti TaxID=340320 RepID=A0A4Q7U188_9MICO|nr:nucleotide exchange factor GrpE [Leucobacter luti]MBL3699158.1 nucleotide exchange factor GrpE [Leucobacter luti]RZT66657.1 molecular chaperone GrpE [Leucobacter luti]